MRRYRDTDVSVDENGVVRPGGRVRVPVTMMDSMDKIQQQVAADYMAERPSVHGADSSPLAFAALARAILLTMICGAAISATWQKFIPVLTPEKSQEFRGDPGGAYYQGGAGEWRGSQPGDDCTMNGLSWNACRGGRQACL